MSLAIDIPATTKFYTLLLISTILNDATEAKDETVSRRFMVSIMLLFIT
jgi:hypothetical protein